MLVVIFNHKFNKNIPLLRNLYKERFENLAFIVPFYEGCDDDVIPVYESSYQFEGYIAQAEAKLSKYPVSHFIFIGDDLILNPQINQDNILPVLSVGQEDAYIESITPLKETNSWFYWRFTDAMNAFKTAGVNYASEIPSLENARNKAEEFGFNDVSIHGYIKSHTLSIKKLRGCVNEVFNRVVNPLDIEYPLFTGYSDFLVIPKAKIKEYAKICGVFAAMGLFVEIAIPTALVLMFDVNNVKTQKDTTILTPKLWEVKKEVVEFEKNCNYKIDRMEQYWPDNYLYLHPVKLSKWSE